MTARSQATVDAVSASWVEHAGPRLQPWLRLARLAALYVSDGLRGRFRNVAPGDWSGLGTADSVRGYLAEHGLRYDAETDAPADVPAGSTQDHR